SHTPSSGGRIAGLHDLRSSPAPRGPPLGGSDDDSDEEGAGGESWFAGGERSGINVENPDRPGGPPGANNMVREILRRAAQAPRPEEPAPRNAFFGSGNTLGSDEVPSSFIPDPEEVEQETAIRYLTFWKNGFSIEDGPLMEYDNPENQRILEAINSGNAPPSYLNVQVGQPVELRVTRRVDEEYVAPKKLGKAFSGAGHRLGGIVPTELSSSTPQHVPGAFPSQPQPPTPSNESTVAGLTTRFEVDQTQPTTSVQIRLADGTRLVARMNLTHTVGDVRGFIRASRPQSEAQPFTIGTTFPNRILEDDGQTIEQAGLVNSVVVMRWS
ncbi:uncharacterized protein EI90DRAFT_2910018, partial [Cantharellus anzutake]|uniref:uncharacterized protein n=1 Tax=Cantharellus anzutake TaxID=1750568 RepID=UPI00190421BA